jgi:hypothetical protein
MHFHNGAVAISYDSPLRLRLVDEGKVGADLSGIVTTLGPGSADPAGNVTSYAASLCSEIGALLAPDDSPPTK